MRKVFIVLLTLAMLVGITASAYAATEMTIGPTTTIGNDAVNPYDSSAFTKGYGDSEDDLLGNANASGDDSIMINDGSTRDAVIKSDNMTDAPNDTTASVQRTHGEYKNNTNSCASCHQTHTGAAKNLLIKAGVFETCTACHDGTLGFYDVFATGEQASTAGTFGGTAAGNASVHMADGTIAHKYAPGGNLKVTGTNNGTWTEVFDCASCHAPHGSYSDRLLHYSPNNMANVSINSGGQKLEANSIVAFSALPAVVKAPTEKDVKVVKGTAAELGLTGVSGDAIVVMKAVYDSETKIGGWVKEDLPWLYGGPHGGKPYTAFMEDASDTIYNDDITINFGAGYATGIGLADVTLADVARAYVVKLSDATHPMIDLPAAAQGYFAKAIDPAIYQTTPAGMGVAIGKYCGACHTDYRAKSGTATGMYEVAFRHTTNNDDYQCLKCHFAHGTDVTIMSDAKDHTVADLVTDFGISKADATAYLLDKNPSSALKRYTNMSVCWKCHTSSKSTQLKNNDEYWTSFFTDADPLTKVPSGFGGGH